MVINWLILSNIPDNYLGFGGDGVVMICAVYSAVIYYNVCQLQRQYSQNMRRYISLHFKGAIVKEIKN